MTSWFTYLGMEYGWAWFIATIIDILVIALPLMLAVAMIIYADRKIWAAMALRRGPNVVGPFGLLQSFADGLKVFLQETIIPSAANKGLFLIAPIITFTVALIVWAVVPFQAGVVLANINVGLLYVLAASSLGVYGIIIAGWASNSKYPFYSALRAAAQMVSYEVSIGFVLISVVLWAGSFNLSTIVEAQRGYAWGWINGNFINPLLFPMAVVFFISSLAETQRAPFDLTEAESELVAGYQTEYSSMSFALYWLGEYANVILMCALNAILFWGGYLPPLNIGWMYAGAGDHLALHQDPGFLLPVQLGEGDRTALSLRPADAAGLEDFPAAVAHLRFPSKRLVDGAARGAAGMTSLFPLALAMLTQPAAVYTADEDVTLLECRFGDAAADGSVKPNKKLAAAFSGELVGGRKQATETYDPNLFLKGVVLDDIKINGPSLTLVGTSKRPHPFITIFRDRPGVAGSVYSAIDYLDEENNRLGFCFLFTGADGKNRLDQVRELSAKGEYK